jgi:hypothetical protein
MQIVVQISDIAHKNRYGYAWPYNYAFGEAHMNDSLETRAAELQQCEQRLTAKSKKLRKLRKTLTRKERELGGLEERLCADNKHHDFMIEYKSQAYNALYNSAMEKDKSLLTIAVAGIGFIVTVIDNDTDPAWIKYAAYAACICFLICILQVLEIFKANQELLICSTTDDDSTGAYIAGKLRNKDMLANCFFYTGILVTTVVGFVAN